MKTSHALALAAIAGGAYLITRRNGAGAGRESPFKPGTFDPKNASKMPDFERVTNHLDDREADWMYWVNPPGYHALGTAAFDAIEFPAYYKRQLWETARKISIQTLTVGDFDRAAYFLAGAWKRGVGAGCEETVADSMFREISADLEDVASGLDIGAAIGIGLASIFGYGEGAKASDQAFGFGRGASEVRSAEVDTKFLPESAKIELAALDVRAAVKKDPDGNPQGASILRVNGRPLASMANLFACSWQKWSDGAAPIDGYDFRVALAKPGLGTIKIPFYVEVGEGREGEGTPDDPGNRGGKPIKGQYWLRRAFERPWHSREMGCFLPTLREKCYVRARMYRTLDLIRSYAMPTEAITADPEVSDSLSSFIIEGDTMGATYITFSYMADNFGKIGGSIFPPLPEDTRLTDYQRNEMTSFVPFKEPANGDIPIIDKRTVYTAPVAPTATPVPVDPVPVATGDVPTETAGAPIPSAPTTFLRSTFTRVR
jgi:hypothetical protein